ncbi:DUF2269 domain-containing protein [Corynebacterium pacaense]|uniref:DUF2269 domain-containing protein n=1 Tax=Corynebacterium pacaense TaxID=1816684 RepID=UPI003CCC1CC6
MIMLHVIAAILFLGPVTVATSSFHVRAVEAHNGDTQAAGAAKTLFKITQTYGVLSLLVPLLGLAIMFLDTSYFRQGVFHASIALAVIAWALLFFVIIPRQKKLMGALGLLEADELEGKTFEVADWAKAKAQLSMFGGIWALLWVIIAVLMLL